MSRRSTAWDQYTVSESGLYLTDTTTANATSSRHGLMPKLSGSSTDVFRGDGTFGTIAATGLPDYLKAPSYVDAPPSSPNADDHEYQNGDTIGGTTLGSPGTAPAIANNRLAITGNAPGVAASMVAVVYTAPGTPYEFTSKVRLRSTPGTFSVTSLMLRSSVSGRFRQVALTRTAADFHTYQVNTDAYTALTTRSASTNATPITQPYVYLRVTNDGTTGTYQVSEDGGSDNWHTLLSETLSTHFTGGNLPDQYGVGVDSFAGTARVGFIEWLRRTA